MLERPELDLTDPCPEGLSNYSFTKWQLVPYNRVGKLSREGNLSDEATTGM